ncbi:hypothetical protein HDU76_011140 [Blyttiomyces sp. JEL0837]|nr:hypothetical protein HDU76_011140 [Blyttiomyces sp. JEL0837]
MIENGLQILTTISVTAEMFQKHDYSEAFSILQSVDARYIALLGSPDFTTDFYVLANNYSLISPRIVWFGLNTPIPETTSLTEAYGPDAVNLMQGFVYPNPDFPDSTSPSVQKITETWSLLSEIDPRYCNRQKYWY